MTYTNTNTFVQEMRLVSEQDGAFDWVVGGFYLHRDLDLVGVEPVEPGFLAARGITGLPADATFNALRQRYAHLRARGFR